MAKSTRKKVSSEPKATATKAKAGEDALPLDTSIAEDTIAAPRPSRKRSGDFFDFTGEDDANEAPSTKATLAKTAKPKKKTKTAPVADDDTKPSKVDGHPVTTAKTQPGGDMVEVEPTKPSRRGKAKKANDETVDGPSLEPPKAAEKVNKPKKSKKTEAETEAPVKPTSSKADAKKPKAPSSSEPKARAKKSKDAGDGGSSVKTPKSKKAADDGSKAAAKKAKKTSKDDAVEVDDILRPPESDPEQEPVEKPLEPADKGKKAISKTSKLTQSSEPAKRGRKPKQSQALGLGENTEINPSEGKKAEKAADAAESSKKPTKPRKPKTVKDSTKAGGDVEAAAAENAKGTNNVDGGPAKAEASKSRKRKTPVGADTDALHTQVLDPLSEHASAKKKQKKSQSNAPGAPGSSLETVIASGQDTAAKGLEASTKLLHSKVLDPLSEQASSTKRKPKKSKPSALEAAGNKLGDILASGLDTAAQGVNAAKEYAADVANSAQKSIMGDVTGVAEAVVDEKEKAEASAKKVSKVAPKKSRSKKVSEVDTVSAEPSGKAADIDVQPENQATALEEEGEEDVEEDDQTLALLKGFDSDDEDGVSGDEGYKQGDEVPEIPNAKTTDDKLKSANDEADGPGVVYVGRIPHGFYEHEMRAYFSQFGPITRLRLSRNRKTGKSKHYAFLEFESAAVAKIVASTMDNYLLFGHILKCKYATPEQLHADLWKGANKRFKAVPWSKIEGRKLEMAMGREGWEKRIETEKKRRVEKNEATKELGYEFEGNGLKGVDEVPVREGVKDIEGGEAAGEEVVEEEKTVVIEGGQGEGTVVVSEEIRTTRVKRGGKGKGKEAGDGAAAPVAKRARKAKAAVQEQAASVLEKPEDVVSGIQDQVAPVVENAQEVTAALQNQFVSTFQAVNDTSLTEKASSVVETVKDTVQDTSAPVTEQAQDAVSTVQEETAPAVTKKAKRARENVEREATSVAKKAKTAVEGEAEGAAKKGRKSKKATSS
ncbi:hypothetical protein MMC07_004940 [Pseudocyphellaria aurata]|nr:hypothetical protein [Pseudocyphellaria aurata]